MQNKYESDAWVYIFWVTQTLSLLLSESTCFAFSYQLIQETQSITVYSVVELLEGVTAIICLPWVGYLIDTRDPANLIVFSDGLSALLSVCLVLQSFYSGDRNHIPSVFWIYTFKIVSQACNSFQEPSIKSIMFRRLPSSHASALMDISEAIAEILSPMFMVWATGKYKLSGLLIMDQATFIVAACTLYFIKQSKGTKIYKLEKRKAEYVEKGQDDKFLTNKSGQKNCVHKANQASPSIIKGSQQDKQVTIGGPGESQLMKKAVAWKNELSAGWDHIKSDSELVIILLLQSAQSAFDEGGTILFLPFMLSVLGSSESFSVIAALSGCGMILGSVVVAAFGFSHATATKFCFLFCTIEVVVILLLTNISIEIQFVVSAAFIYYFFIPFHRACFEIIWQKNTPRVLQGRVIAFLNLTSKISRVIGAAFATLVTVLSSQFFDPAVAAPHGSSDIKNGTQITSISGWRFIMTSIPSVQLVIICFLYRKIRSTARHLYQHGIIKKYS